MLINNFCFFYVLIIHLILNEIQTSRIPCIKKFYSTPISNSFVCVCNSTYCDTIEPLDNDLNSNLFYQEYITSISEYRLDKFKFKFEDEPNQNSSLNFRIDRSIKYQNIIGFGGAITDAASYNVYSLSTHTIQNLLNSYFDKSGIEYSVIRVPVAGVDFSLKPYTYDDTTDDFDLNNFKLTSEDVKWKIPFIKDALKLSTKKIKIFASAWTAPPWMKTNNDYSGNGTLIGPEGGKYYQTWANYYLKFFKEYKKNNISFWGMTAQNEPTDGYLYKFSFNAMGFTPQSQATFIYKNLGPTLENNGFGNIKIMILDDQRLFLPDWPQKMFSYLPDSFKYVSGIAVHWYLDFLVPAKQLDLTHFAFPQLFIFGTEACSGAGPVPHVILGGYNRAESYAKYILQDLNHWVGGWTDWNMALNEKGGPNWANNFVDSPIITNSTSDEFYKQPMFYILGHFSKFLNEGSIRVETSIKNNIHKSVSYVSFINEKLRQTIFIILNESDNDFEYSIYDSDLNKYINSISYAHSIKTKVWSY